MRPASSPLALVASLLAVFVAAAFDDPVALPPAPDCACVAVGVLLEAELDPLALALAAVDCGEADVDVELVVDDEEAVRVITPVAPLLELALEYELPVSSPLVDW